MVTVSEFARLNIQRVGLVPASGAARAESECVRRQRKPDVAARERGGDQQRQARRVPTNKGEDR